MLTREQILRAYLLTLGEPPKERIASAGPALLDREAGFVLGRQSWDGWRDDVIRRLLAARYPQKVLDASMPHALALWSNVVGVAVADLSSADNVFVVRALPAVRLDLTPTVDEGVNSFTFSAPVHDEVILEVPPEERERAAELTLDAMRGACELCVPLEVNLSWGDSWADAKGQ